MTRKKLTDQEIDQIKTIQKSYDEIILRIGELVYQQKTIDMELSRLDKQMESLEISKNEFSTTLISTYGPGTIDVESGEIITE